MKEADVLLSLSGHYHRGAEDTRDGNTTFVNAPGLCEAPFPFMVVRINEGQIQSQRHELGMPTLAPQKKAEQSHALDRKGETLSGK